MSKEIDKNIKILLDLAKASVDKNTGGDFKDKIMAGRDIPSPSFSLKPKIIIVKPKTDEEK